VIARGERESGARDKVNKEQEVEQGRGPGTVSLGMRVLFGYLFRGPEFLVTLLLIGPVCPLS